MTTQPTLRRTGWDWFPWGLAAAFAFVFAINGTMFYFAKTSFPGVAAVKPYEIGAAYNSVLDAAAKQAAKAWQVTERIDANQIGLSFTDRDGLPLGPFLVSGTLTRPVGTSPPLPLTFQSIDRGTYRSDQSIPGSGQWLFDFQAWEDGVMVFAATRRILAP